MRWRIQQDIGNSRYRMSFLFFPKTIAGQARWLEVAEWSEEWVYIEKYLGCCWVPTRWLNS